MQTRLTLGAGRHLSLGARAPLRPPPRHRPNPPPRRPARPRDPRPSAYSAVQARTPSGAHAEQPLDAKTSMFSRGVCTVFCWLSSGWILARERAPDRRYTWIIIMPTCRAHFRQRVGVEFCTIPLLFCFRNVEICFSHVVRGKIVYLV